MQESGKAGRLAMNSSRQQLSRTVQSSASLAPHDGEFHTVSRQTRLGGEQQLLALAWTTALDRHHPL